MRSYSLVVAEAEAPRVESLDHFVDRLLAEVRDRVELALGLGDEVADGLDPGPLEAVVGAHTELELLDQNVVHRVGRTGRGAAGAVDRTRIEDPGGVDVP